MSSTLMNTLAEEDRRPCAAEETDTGDGAVMEQTTKKVTPAKTPQPVSLASALKLCQAAVSLSKGLRMVTLPLLGSIRKALVASLLLSMEYLPTTKQKRHFCNRGGD